MRIAAALCWYDERPETLQRCISSLEGVVDEVVALDGRWRLHADDAPAISPIEQRIALTAAVADAGFDVSGLYAYWQPWPDQVTKRACLMALAAERADWILVIDADEYVGEADSVALRELLSSSGRLVGAVTHTNVRPGSSAGLWRRRGIRRVYPAGTTVVGAHNGYLFDGRWLHGDPLHVQVEPAVNLAEVLKLEHDKVARTPRRRHERSVYRTARRATRVEAW